MKTKTINISQFFESETPEIIPEVTIKKIGFGEQNQIIDEVSDIKIKGKDQVEVKTKYGQLRTLTLLKCLVKAPFPITLEYISNELDASLGDFLFEECDKFNTVRQEKKE